MSSNPAGRASREICAKNTATSMETGGRWPVAASPEKKIEKFCYYFLVFSHFHFAECKSLPSAFLALGKGFTECPIKSTRQIAVCRQKDAVCCMPSVTLGKAVAECFWAIAECPWHSAKRLYPIVMLTKYIHSSCWYLAGWRSVTSRTSSS